MAGRVLASYVHVRDPKGGVVVLEPGQELPDWAKKLVTNPKAFADAVTVEEQEAPSGSSTDPGSTSYDELKAAELKAELKRRELPQTGNRPELIARLVKDDTESAAEESDTSAENAAEEPDTSAETGEVNDGSSEEQPSGSEE